MATNCLGLPYYDSMADICSHILSFERGHCPAMAIEMCVLSVTPLDFGWQVELVDSESLFNLSAHQAAIDSFSRSERAFFVFKLLIVPDGLHDERMTFTPGALLFADEVLHALVFGDSFQGATSTEHIDFVQIL